MHRLNDVKAACWKEKAHPRTFIQPIGVTSDPLWVRKHRKPPHLIVPLRVAAAIEASVRLCVLPYDNPKPSENLK